jgi:hypothetical protein
MLSSIFNSQDETAKSKLAELGTAITELNTLLFDTSSCGVNYDITNQIPLWIIYEKEDRISNGNSGLSIFDFAQKYYDWLYCDNVDGAGYELSSNFIDIIDVEKTRTEFLERLSQIYVDGFQIKGLEHNGGLITTDNLRKFIKNVRRSFYHKKTTEDGIRYFFTTLFGVNQEDIKIEVPKKNILRLNGGRFYDENFTFPGRTGTYDLIGALSGSYLNGSRMQDGNWIQDWSYLLSVGVAATEYKDTYLNVAHPAGMKVVFEKTLADYQGPTFDETIPYVCELPRLSNYAPYGISFDYTGKTAGIYQAWSGAALGISFVGITVSTGCCGASYSGFTGPSYLFPNWTSQTDVFNFKDLYIGTMLELCYPSDLGSPNAGAVCS